MTLQERFDAKEAKRLNMPSGSYHPEELLASIRPGDRVTILRPAGRGRNGQEWQEATGRAVIISPGHVALNMGGRFGTPGVATVENLVRVGKKLATLDCRCDFKA